MAALANAKECGAPFSNEIEYVRVEYDFANDGGATGTLDVLTCNSAVVVKSFHAVVKTTFTSSATGDLQVGISGGDTDAAMTTSAAALANLTANAVINQASTTPFRVAAGGKIIQSIGTATMTAGKIEYVFGIMKA